MNDWFEWNGVRCTNYGIHCASLPVIQTPSERVEYTDVPGRNGSLIVTEGDEIYDDLELSVTCFVERLSNPEEVIKFLRGTGKVTFASRPDGFYYARIINPMQFAKIVRGSDYRTFTVTFRCEPFFYKMEDALDTLTTSPRTITNHGMSYSQPRIEVRFQYSGTGTGAITLNVGEQSVTITPKEIPTFSSASTSTYAVGAHVYRSGVLYECIVAITTGGAWDASKWSEVTEGYLESGIIIDSDMMECFDIDGLSYANQYVSITEFPILKSGENEISWSYEAASGSSQTATVTEVKILKRERGL